jgi:hypothetical protein
VELALAPAEVAAMGRRPGLSVEPERLAFYRAAYLAFHLGLCLESARAETDRSELRRLRQAVGRYASLVRRVG